MKKMLPFLLIILLAGAGVAGYVFFLMPEKPPVDSSFTLDPGDQFVTDIAGSRRLLCTDLVFKMADVKREAYYTANMPIIRNAVISILRSKSEADLRQDQVETGLDQEILDRLMKNSPQKTF
jgi:flagellar basal body-associated protein FliL